MTQKYTVLVTGATGIQGGAIAAALMAMGHQLRILTRNLDSPAAKHLTEQGAEVLQGDFIERWESVFGQRFDIAGDELTGEQSAAILSEESGFQVLYQNYPVSVMREQSEDMALMYEWFDRVGYNVNITALRKDFSDVDWQDYRQWVASKDWKVR